MSTTTAGILFIVSIVAALALVHVPFGDYMYRVYTGKRHLRGERWIYRLIGIDPEAEQSWRVYIVSVLAFSVASVLLLYAVMRIQHRLWYSLGFKGPNPDLSWNTAISFVTNTNWQNYSGESTMGYLVQFVGLAVQNFMSAAVGIAVAIAVVRGFARRRSSGLGNFWVDLVRGTIRILLPIAITATVVLLAGGAIENLHQPHTIQTITGLHQTITGGPVAGQEVIKELGTNGGGFYNANSAHPFENPTTWTNWFEIFLLLVISFSLPRTFGRMVGDKRQGYAILAAMAVLALISVGLMNGLQLQHHGTVPTAAGSSMEGVASRFGVPQSATFADATTLTSTGAVDSAHDSYTSLGGMIALFNMMLGEVAPGGVGSGLSGILDLAVLTVFVAGLMVGRTPEYLGKKISSREIKYASLYFLTMPTIVLFLTGLAMALPGERAAMRNGGPHGLSEVLYAFTSTTNNNGSAFAGLTSTTTWWNTAQGLSMVLGRFVPMIFILAMAGSLAQQRATPPTAGTLPTHRPQFVGMLVGVVLILVSLAFLPALALGPLAEGIH